VRDEFGTPRRTEIIDGGADMEDEDLIQREDMVVTVTHEGYIKRVPLSIYRAQARGGKGRSGMSTKDDGFRDAAVRGQHAHADPVLLLARHRLQGKGLAPADRHAAVARQGADQHAAARSGDRITAILPLPEDESEWDKLDVMFATTRGTVRRNKLSDFVDVKRNGKIAMKFDEEGDAILAVETCTENDDVLLTADSGQCIRFAVTDVRVFAGRSSQGVRGIAWATATARSR
jgi:DNA gyrase subunit A